MPHPRSYASHLVCHGCDGDGYTFLKRNTEYSKDDMGHCTIAVRDAQECCVFTAHHDHKYDYKIGKLHCKHCGVNLGNVQYDPYYDTRALVCHLKKQNVLLRQASGYRAFELFPLTVKASGRVGEKGRMSCEEVKNALEAPFHQALVSITRARIPTVEMLQSAIIRLRGEPDEPEETVLMPPSDSDTSAEAGGEREGADETDGDEGNDENAQPEYVTVAAVQALQADMQAQIDLLRAQVQQLRVAAKK